VTRARSNTLLTDTLAATMAPPGLIKWRSISLWNSMVIPNSTAAVSGHQSAASRTLTPLPIVQRDIDGSAVVDRDLAKEDRPIGGQT
jgi:hypothetical protein